MNTSHRASQAPLGKRNNHNITIIAGLLVFCAGCAAPEVAEDDDVDGSSTDAPPDAQTHRSCDAPVDRIDPRTAAALGSDAFAALGRGRSGLSGAGSKRSNASSRYVSADHGADDASGTEDDPWRTLQHAADVVAPGTTVLVDDSADYEGGLEIHRSGAPDAWVVFIGLDAHTMPRLLGVPDRDAVVDISASYVVFEGFEIAGQRRASLDDDAIGIRIEARDADISHVEVRNNLIHDIGPGLIEDDACYHNGHGIIAQAEGWSISDLVIDGNELHDLYVGNSECLVVNGNIEDFCVTNNYVHDVDNIAIDIIGYEKNGEETARLGTIEDNVVLDASNYWPYCSRGNCTYPAGDESSDGIYVDGGASLNIAYNVVGRADHGIELQSENGELIREVSVHDNLVFNSNYRNFTLVDGQDVEEFDNVFVDEPALSDPDLQACRD